MALRLARPRRCQAARQQRFMALRLARPRRCQAVRCNTPRACEPAQMPLGSRLQHAQLICCHAAAQQPTRTCDLAETLPYNLSTDA